MFSALLHPGQRTERRRTKKRKKMTKKMRRTMVKRMVSNSNMQGIEGTARDILIT